MADSLNRRDIDMIFRAETDSATRSVGELRKSVSGLRKELSEQVAAVERGEGSLDALAATTRELKQAQDELGTARSLLTQLNTLTGGAEKTEARLAKLNSELDVLRAKEAAAVKPSAQLTKSINAKNNAIAATSEKLAGERAALDEYRGRVEAILGPVDQLEGSFREVAKISKDAAAGLAIAGKGADDFAAKSRQAAAASKDLATFQDIASKAGLLQQDIDYLAQFENRIERVTAARNEQIAADLRYQDVLEQVQLEQQRLAQANAFRQVAAEARAAVTDVTRFKTESIESEAAVNRLAMAVADLANPARAAANDMSKLGDVVDTVAARVEAGGKRRTGAMSQDLNDLEQALAGLQRQAAQVDGLRAQQSAVDAASQEWARAKTEVLSLATAIEMAGADATDEMVRSLKQAEGAAESAGMAFQRESTQLSRLEKAAQAASIDIYHLEAAEKRIIATSARAGKAAEHLRRSLGGGSGSGAFLGLKPYELQNLGYQIQDIFVSLASGQAPLTVLTQQGTQIAAIFPGAWAALAGALPILAPLVVLLGSVALGTARILENAQRAREVSAALVEMGTATKATAGDIETAIAGLDDLGASAEDAKKVILSLVKEGMDPKFFEDFGSAALAFSEITGKDLPEATERLVEGLTHGKDEVLALNDEFNFLTPTERDHIKAMNDSTDAAEIRTVAFDAFHRQAIAVADELAGPSKDAVESLESAWSDFLDTLANVAGFEDVDSWLADLTGGLAVFVRFLSNAIKQLRDSFGKMAAVYKANGGGVRGVLAALAATNEISAGEKSGGQLLDQSINELANERLARQEQRRTRSSSGDVGGGTRGARKTREGIKPKKTRKAGKSDAQKLAEQLEREQEQLQRALEAMTSKALGFQQVSIEQQLQNASDSIESEYAKLYRQLDDFGKKFGAGAKINGQSQTDYRAQLDANKKILVQREQLKIYEQGVNDLLDERKTQLAQIEERQNAGLISAADALEQSAEVTSRLNPSIEKLASDARLFAIALGGANPSPELKAFIAKLDGVTLTLGTTKIDEQKAAIANLNEMEKDRNDIISRRDNLIAANAELVKLGLMTESDAREAAAAAYNREAPALRALIAEERIYNGLLLQRKIITQSEYDARMAQLAALDAQTTYVDERVLAVNNAAQEAFTQGFTTMFNTFAQGLANLVTGGGSVGDMLTDLGMAALNFAADFLKAIADVIVQMLALQAVKAILGASSGGLGALFFHGGGDVGHGGKRMTRSNFSVSPMAVAAAPRYHNGTPGAGLRRDEMLAVLKRGEKVTTEEQQRLEAKRDARGSGGGRGLRQVLAFGDDEVAGAMAGPAGEEVTVTHIRRNKARIRQELGID